MIGIQELDKKLKPKGLVLIEIETSFPYESLVRKIVNEESTLVYVDGPVSLGEKLFGVKPITIEAFNKILINNETKPKRPVIASLTPLFYFPERLNLNSLNLNIINSDLKPERLLYFLNFIRDKYLDDIAIAIIHADAVPDRFGRFLEISADIVIRMHPMGRKAVAIIRRHPRPELIGETIEFSVVRMRRKIEDARDDVEKLKELIELLKKKEKLEESEIKELMDLLTSYRFKDEAMYSELYALLKKKTGKSDEEMEAYSEEDIEEYERSISTNFSATSRAFS